MLPVVLLVLVLLLLVFLLVRRCTEGFASLGQQQTIFINVSSYRDRECNRTVADAFAKADQPGRVFVGICQQNKEQSEDCTKLPGINPAQVKTMTLDYTEAKGPTFARYLCSTMYSGQDYVLQIDSHTKFVQSWDTKLIKMLAMCPSAKPVLTHYPHAYDASSGDGPLPSDLSTQVPVMCRSKWNEDGLPTFEAVMKPIEKAGLRKVPFMAGGMVFASGQLFQEVQLDPGLDFCFVGEECLLSARLFTHGWDLFTPSENVVLHHYVREASPRFWQDIQNYRTRQLKTLSRVKQLMGLEEPDISRTDKFGMGRERSMTEWWTFSRLDPSNKTSSSAEFFCRD